jgi:pyrroloquinoline quinone biosynthesis protein D
MIADDARPRLPRGVRLREDKVRERWVLLAPERILKVNPIAVEILKLCDGGRTLGEIVAGLAERFNAEPARVGADVRALLASLHEKRMAEL